MYQSLVTPCDPKNTLYDKSMEANILTFAEKNRKICVYQEKVVILRA